MASPSAGATATVPASTPSNTCGPSVSATRLRSWNMSESDLPIDPTITIQAETSLVDPDTCKFTVSRTVHPGGPFFFDDRKRARGSPLVERLFALPGVAYVLIAGNVVTVGKEPGASWSGLRPAIGTGLRTQLLTGVPAILEATANAGTRERTDAESRAVVQQLLDRKVFIAMSGGCQGCSASKVTLRQGFEVMLRRVAPEIANIVDTTDHSAGN